MDLMEYMSKRPHYQNAPYKNGLSDLTLSMPAALGTLISKNIFNRLRWSNAEQHASSKATTQETLNSSLLYMSNSSFDSWFQSLMVRGKKLFV
jgi:hypothetical protein